MEAMWAWMESPGYKEYSPLFPNPLVCIRDMAPTAAEEFVERMIPWNGLGTYIKETWKSIEISTYFDPMMVLWAMLIGVVLTGIRSLLNTFVLIKFAKHSKLTRDSTEKLPGSAWKFCVYLFTWLWSLYLIHKSNSFFDLSSHWNKWHPGQPVEPGVYWLFVFEVGFYLHYLYAMAFLDKRQKDFAILLLHHVLTILLIIGCYSLRFHIIGVVLIFIHDIGDVFLEGSKCINYFKIQNRRPNKYADMGANVGFLLFTVQFFLFRIYWFMTKALYSTLYVSVKLVPGGPLYVPFNIMLYGLLFMQIYWFWLILKILNKVLILREELSDIRDIEEDSGNESGEEEKSLGNGILQQNSLKKTQ